MAYSMNKYQKLSITISGRTMLVDSTGSRQGARMVKKERLPPGVAPDGIRTAKETQHQPNSTAEKGDILNELRMGIFSKSFAIACEFA
jgi:hypothetical protein